jgi:hypothetical protein
MPLVASKNSILTRIRARRDSWVMLDGTRGFVKLPKEVILFESPPRTTLTLQTPNTYPGKEPFALNSNGGIAYLTNQRVVYLPTASSPRLQSFAAPILNLQDTHVSAPFFGPNVWTGILIPVAGGGIPPQHPYVEIKMTFRDGGAYDFHTKFVNIKETLSQQIEVARESGRMVGQDVNVDLFNVHLEQLPAYEESGGTPPSQPEIGRPIPGFPAAQQLSGSGAQAGSGVGISEGSASSGHARDGFHAPSEPPPGYEEAQQTSVVHDLEEGLRRMHR